MFHASKRLVALGIVAAVLIISTITAFALDIETDQRYQNSDLPGVTFLGEGPGTFDLPEGDELFLVKAQRENEYREVKQTSYTTTLAERVWSVDEDLPGDGIIVYDEDWDLEKTVTAGCIISYVQIDDDIDDRRNGFFIDGVDGDPVHVLDQGMVVYGSFVVPRDGALWFYAQDSVGLIETDCQQPPTETPTPIPTATATPPLPTASPTITPTSDGTMVPPTSPATPNATATSILPPPTLAPATATVSPTPTKVPRLDACLRINFDVGGDSAERGLYIAQEVGGKVLAEWYAEQGWQDSGWVRGIDISYPSVYVQVFYYSGPGASPVEMKILNPAPGTSYGWASRGICHAIEVAWP